MLTWQTAYAGDFPVARYEIMVNGEKTGEVIHKPQVLKKEPFVFSSGELKGTVAVVAVDSSGNRTEALLS
jgi:hypothetical protein